MIRKLFLVTTNFKSDYIQWYVIAYDPTSAYNKVREYLDDYDIGFKDERELVSVTLVASAEDYPACRIRLLIAQEG